MSKSSGNTSISERGGAECGAVSVESGAIDADMATLIEVWPILAAGVKKSVIELIVNSGYATRPH